ncbi:glycosyltransferase family 4 protein, partial [Patescibacteria group bacterium]|nr:glycosyltransferase family 4 protein [Patescibacteria group bacterium]
MVIGIDSRAISQDKYSGVEEYAFNLLNALFAIDRKNQYILFNAGKSPSQRYLDFSSEAQKNSPNVKVLHSKISNRLLNVFFKCLHWPKIDKLAGGADIVFSPNINLLPVSRECKKIITFHDLSFARYSSFFSLKQRLWHKFVNPAVLAREADFIIAVSQSTKNDLVEIYGVPREKIRVIYSGVNVKCQMSNVKTQNQISKLKSVREKYNLPEKYILYLGTIEPRKNIIGLIKAFELFNAKYPSSAKTTAGKQIPPKDKPTGQANTKYQLVIAGAKGWLYGDIFKAAQNSVFRNEIIFTGTIADEDRAFLYSMASLFVYPSFYEGFGFPPLEAMSAGIPVIVSNCSSLPEAVGNAALMVNPYNFGEIAWAMNEVLSNNNLRDKMIKKGYEQVKKFSWEKCA